MKSLQIHDNQRVTGFDVQLNIGRTIVNKPYHGLVSITYLTEITDTSEEEENDNLLPFLLYKDTYQVFKKHFLNVDFYNLKLDYDNRIIPLFIKYCSLKIPF